MNYESDLSHSGKESEKYESNDVNFYKDNSDDNDDNTYQEVSKGE